MRPPACRCWLGLGSGFSVRVRFRVRADQAARLQVLLRTNGGVTLARCRPISSSSVRGSLTCRVEPSGSPLSDAGTLCNSRTLTQTLTLNLTLTVTLTVSVSVSESLSVSVSVSVTVSVTVSLTVTPALALTRHAVRRARRAALGLWRRAQHERRGGILPDAKQRQFAVGRGSVNHGRLRARRSNTLPLRPAPQREQRGSGHRRSLLFLGPRQWHRHRQRYCRVLLDTSLCRGRQPRSTQPHALRARGAPSPSREPQP